MKTQAPLLLIALLLAPAMMLAPGMTHAEAPAHDAMAMHDAAGTRQPSADARELVNYPPEIKAHVLANMRGHVQTLARIMAALSQSQYAQAADLADAGLGMESEAAAGCRPEGATPNMSTHAMHLDHMMAALMPEKMRVLGQNMHRSANEFATVARQAAKSGNGSAALAAVGNIMEQCAACHAAYRLN